MLTYLISIENVRRPEATNVRYQVAGKGREFFDCPKALQTAEQVGLIVRCKACQHQVEPDPAETSRGGKALKRRCSLGRISWLLAERLA